MNQSDLLFILSLELMARDSVLGAKLGVSAVLHGRTWTGHLTLLEVGWEQRTD